MAKSKESFQKREKEKLKQKLRQEKKEKMEQRKASGSKGKSLDDMMAYIDENGNITSTPPDPRNRKEINAEDIVIGVPKFEPEEEESPYRTGVVSFFNDAKGFGFIIDDRSGERVFVHQNQVADRIRENDKIGFEVEHTPKGPSAVNARKI